jgi:putative transposase
MTTPACARYAGYRFPAEIISHAVWLYFRFPLGLRMQIPMISAGHSGLMSATCSD